MWSNSVTVGDVTSKEVLIDCRVKMETMIKDECVGKGEEFWKKELNVLL